jgi:hypothetical protein
MVWGAYLHSPKNFGAVSSLPGFYFNSLFDFDSEVDLYSLSLLNRTIGPMSHSKELFQLPFFILTYFGRPLPLWLWAMFNPLLCLCGALPFLQQCWVGALVRSKMQTFSAKEWCSKEWQLLRITNTYYCNHIGSKTEALLLSLLQN